MNTSWWVDVNELDRDQQAVITLPARGNFLVEGPPGSGKTNLLALRAKYLQAARRSNFIIISFTGGLREFLAHGMSQYGISESSVQTLFSWAKRFCLDYNVRLEQEGSFQEKRLMICESIETIISKRDFKPYYDTILLDEAQDYTRREIDIFRKVAENIFMVADIKQKIYSEPDDNIDYLKEITDNQITLKYHYRNGRQICKLADYVSKEASSLVASCNYNEKESPSRVEHKKYDSFDAAFNDLVENVSNQLKAYPKEYIGIICKTKEDRDKLGILRNTPIGGICSFHNHEESIDFNENNRVYCLTLHSAKGLEFRAVHMFGWDQWRAPLTRNMTFTAITRTKTSLFVYYFKELFEYFQHAIEQLDPPPPAPALKQLFKA